MEKCNLKKNLKIPDIQGRCKAYTYKGHDNIKRISVITEHANNHHHHNHLKIFSLSANKYVYYGPEVITQNDCLTM